MSSLFQRIKEIESDEQPPCNQSELIEPLGCSHIWERRDKQPWCLPYYISTQCEMELSVDQFNAVQQAYQSGVNAANTLPHRVMFDTGFAKGYEAARCSAIEIAQEYRCDACADAFDNIVTDISRMKP